jgi:hypothetical protein
MRIRVRSCYRVWQDRGNCRLLRPGRGWERCQPSRHQLPSRRQRQQPRCHCHPRHDCRWRIRCQRSVSRPWFQVRLRRVGAPWKPRVRRPPSQLGLGELWTLIREGEPSVHICICTDTLSMTSPHSNRLTSPCSLPNLATSLSTNTATLLTHPTMAVTRLRHHSLPSSGLFSVCNFLPSKPRMHSIPRK